MGQRSESLYRFGQAQRQHFRSIFSQRARVGEFETRCGGNRVLANEELLAIMQRRHGNRP